MVFYKIIGYVCVNQLLSPLSNKRSQPNMDQDQRKAQIEVTENKIDYKFKQIMVETFTNTLF